MGINGLATIQSSQSVSSTFSEKICPPNKLGSGDGTDGNAVITHTLEGRNHHCLHLPGSRLNAGWPLNQGHPG